MVASNSVPGLTAKCMVQRLPHARLAGWSHVPLPWGIPKPIPPVLRDRYRTTAREVTHLRAHRRHAGSSDLRACVLSVKLWRVWRAAVYMANAAAHRTTLGILRPDVAALFPTAQPSDTRRTSEVQASSHFTGGALPCHAPPFSRYGYLARTPAQPVTGPTVRPPES